MKARLIVLFTQAIVVVAFGGTAVSFGKAIAQTRGWIDGV